MMKNAYASLALQTLVGGVIMYLVMFVMIDSLGSFYNNLNMLYMTLMMVAPMVVLMVLAMGEPDLGEAGLGLVAGARMAARRIEQGERDIVERAGAREQVKGLEHEADLLIAIARKLIGAEPAKRAPFDLKRA